MPIYRGTNIPLAAGASFKPDFKPNDRFGPRGGHVRIRSVQMTQIAGDVLTTGLPVQTVFVGNDMVESKSSLGYDSSAQQGITNFTPALEAVGGATDVIDMTIQNIGTTICHFAYVVEIENA